MAVESTFPSRPLRLLLAVDSLEVGGAERHVVDLATALRRKGCGVEVACSVSGGLSEPLEFNHETLVRRTEGVYRAAIGGKALQEPEMAEIPSAM